MQLEKITSKENAKLKAAAKLLQSKKERKAAGAFVAEGKRLCLDAFYSGAKAAAHLCHRRADGAGSDTAGAGAAFAGCTGMLPHPGRSGAPSVRHPKPAGLILCL